MNDLVEQLRWRKETYGFGSVELWERRQRRPWNAPNSRNHQVGPGEHMSREIRITDGQGIPIDDADVPIIARLVEGRTIVKFEREPDSGEDWPHGANSVTLTLDDGSTLDFSGWGYDSSGCDTGYTPRSEESK